MSAFWGGKPMVERLTRKQATAYLRKKGLHLADSHLGWGAKAGTGPRFRYLGTHPVYTAKDLDAWIETRRKAGGRLEAFFRSSACGLAHQRAPAHSVAPALPARRRARSVCKADRPGVVIHRAEAEAGSTVGVHRWVNQPKTDLP